MQNNVKLQTPCSQNLFADSYRLKRQNIFELHLDRQVITSKIYNDINEMGKWWWIGGNPGRLSWAFPRAQVSCLAVRCSEPWKSISVNWEIDHRGRTALKGYHSPPPQPRWPNRLRPLWWLIPTLDHLIFTELYLYIAAWNEKCGI